MDYWLYEGKYNRLSRPRTFLEGHCFWVSPDIAYTRDLPKTKPSCEDFTGPLICIRIYTYVHMYVYAHVYVSKYVCENVYIRLSLSVIYAYKYVYMYACMDAGKRIECWCFLLGSSFSSRGQRLPAFLQGVKRKTYLVARTVHKATTVSARK